MLFNVRLSKTESRAYLSLKCNKHRVCDGLAAYFEFLIYQPKLGLSQMSVMRTQFCRFSEILQVSFMKTWYLIVTIPLQYLLTEITIYVYTSSLINSNLNSTPENAFIFYTPHHTPGLLQLVFINIFIAARRFLAVYPLCFRHGAKLEGNKTPRLNTNWVYSAWQIPIILSEQRGLKEV